MSPVVRVDLHPNERKLRHFGYIAFFAFGSLALLAWLERGVFVLGLGGAREQVAGLLAGLALSSLCFSLLAPRGNWALFVGMSLLSFPIGFVVSHLIMATLFFLIIAPIGLLLRLLGKDLLGRRYQPEASSYWSEARAMRPKADYFSQF